MAGQPTPRTVSTIQGPIPTWICEDVGRGDGCGSPARPDLWGAGEATPRSTRPSTSAPVTVESFLKYLDDRFYDGRDGLGATIFHRVIQEFAAQGVGLLPSGAQKATRAAIVLESQNGLSNTRGTVAMARTKEPNLATSQFYVNVVDNPFLNYRNARNPGYAIFV